MVTRIAPTAAPKSRSSSIDTTSSRGSDRGVNLLKKAGVITIWFQMYALYRRETLEF
jgi:hypothetical protein